MNRMYCLVWNRARGLWMVAHEGAAACGKTGRALQTRRAGALAVALLTLGEFSPLAHAAPPANALPSGAQIVAGQVVLNQSLQNGVARLDINQSTQRAILNWSTFNIGAAAQVNFNQPGSSAIALNRVVSSDPSQIFGALHANGQVFLINPNGVIFGPGAVVNAGGLVASTLGLGDTDFLTGNYRFTRNATSAGILNQGSLTASSGGYLALLAPDIKNTGTLRAQLGSIALAAGDAMTLNLTGDRLVNVIVDPAQIATLVENRGVIQADGGTVLLSAQASDQLIGAAINTSGIIEARGLSDQGGSIVLDGGGAATVTVSGVLDASDTRTGRKGGSVKVLGDKVGLLDQARIDVSGFAGGGAALIGGNWQGKGPERNAQLTFVGADARIQADALVAGDGGTVVVWADGITRFHGSVSANGGTLGGNGGQVETSGKGALDIDGAQVSAQATMGRNGTWLLDPTSIDVVASGKLFATTGDVNQFADFDLSGKGLGTRISPNELALAKASVVLQAQNTITFSSAVTLTFAGAGLTAQAGGNIIVNAGITTNNGQITLSANDPGGTRSASASVSGAGNLNAGSGLITVDTNGSSGGISLAGNINASAGSTFQTGAGTIALTGTGNQFGNFIQVGNTGANDVTVAASSAVNLQTSTVGRNLAVTSRGNITVLGAVGAGGNAELVSAADIVLNGVLTAAGNVDLVAAGTFMNGAGSTALAAGGYRRVYSQSPDQDVTGGLVSNFSRFNCAYASTCAGQLPGTGLGFLYASSPRQGVAPLNTRSEPGNLPLGPAKLLPVSPLELAQPPALPGQAAVTLTAADGSAPTQPPMRAIQDGLQGLYVQYFGRPADPTGLAYWTSVVESGVAAGGDMGTVIDGIREALGRSVEYRAKFSGLTSDQSVNTIFQNQFGRDASPNELAYWALPLAQGKLSIAQVAGAITDSAIAADSSDAAVFKARKDAAQSFTDGLTTQDQIRAYAGEAAGDSARSLLGSITADSLATQNSTGTR